MVFTLLFLWGISAAYQQLVSIDVKNTALREALPGMERAGEYQVNQDILYLWTFDFEDKRCLYALHGKYRGGLTCWEK